VPGADGQAQFSPDGSRIAYVNGSAEQSEIYLLDLQTQERTQVTRFNSLSTFPTWSRDGNTILFSIIRGNFSNIFSIPVDSSGPPQAVAGQANSDEYFPRERP
jgi:Tol biopolymer transport system component